MFLAPKYCLIKVLLLLFCNQTLTNDKKKNNCKFIYFFDHTMPIFHASEVESFLKTLWEKEENADNQDFLLFPQQCFLLHEIRI